MTMTEVTIRGVTPNPNHSTRKGARATDGMVFAPMKYGMNIFDASRDRAMRKPMIKPRGKGGRKAGHGFENGHPEIGENASVSESFYRSSQHG